MHRRKVYAVRFGFLAFSFGIDVSCSLYTLHAAAPEETSGFHRLLRASVPHQQVYTMQSSVMQWLLCCAALGCDSFPQQFVPGGASVHWCCGRLLLGRRWQ
jgi:hypothetical protein